MFYSNVGGCYSVLASLLLLCRERIGARFGVGSAEIRMLCKSGGILVGFKDTQLKVSFILFSGKEVSVR